MHNMRSGIIYGKIPENSIILNPYEAAARLKTDIGFTDDVIRKCERELRRVCDCKYSAVCLDVSYPDENTVDLGFGEIYSKSLYKNLQGCKKAFTFAVTLGMGTDRLLTKLSYISQSEHFITDALASAMAEAVCDISEAEIKKELRCHPRFSPGYGDLPLCVQGNILSLLDARRLLGITLNDALLMSPMKSITAVMGII